MTGSNISGETCVFTENALQVHIKCQHQRIDYLPHHKGNTFYKCPYCLECHSNERIFKKHIENRHWLELAKDIKSGKIGPNPGEIKSVEVIDGAQDGRQKVHQCRILEALVPGKVIIHLRIGTN